jgi:hypothetical protein
LKKPVKSLVLYNSGAEEAEIKEYSLESHPDNIRKILSGFFKGMTSVFYPVITVV